MKIRSEQHACLPYLNFSLKTLNHLFLDGIKSPFFFLLVYLMKKQERSLMGQEMNVLFSEGMCHLHS
jgi:hypothetical protein